jgi:hypothetical protein
MKVGTVGTCSTLSRLPCHVTRITEPTQSPAIGILVAYQKKPIENRFSAKAHFHRTSRICAFVFSICVSKNTNKYRRLIHFKISKPLHGTLNPFPPTPPPSLSLSLSLSQSFLCHYLLFIDLISHPDLSYVKREKASTMISTTTTHNSLHII